MTRNEFKKIEQLWTINARVRKHANELSTLPIANKVTHWTDTYSAEGLVQMHEYIDCEIQNGNAVCFYIEIEYTQKHVAISSDVRLMTTDGYDTIETFVDNKVVEWDAPDSELLSLLDRYFNFNINNYS